MNLFAYTTKTSDPIVTNDGSCESREVGDMARKKEKMFSSWELLGGVD